MAHESLELDRDSTIRLVAAVLAEQHDECAEGRRHLGLDVLQRSRPSVVPEDDGITEEVSTAHGAPRQERSA